MGEASVIRDHVIIFFPLVDWDAPWQRYQYLARAFAKYNTVVYFEPALSINYLLKKPGALWEKLSAIFRVKRKVAENLFVLRSPPILPLGSRSHLTNTMNQFLNLVVIKVSTRGFTERANLCLWINDAIHYQLVKWLKPRISVYDCADAIIYQDHKRQGYHDALRRKIIRESHLSFFTSRLYFKEGQQYLGDCHYVPNGVDTGNFLRRHYPRPKEMEGIKRPILGFVGTIDSRIDQELIDVVLSRKPEASAVLVGPIVHGSCRFKNQDRVFLMGQKDYAEIPNFINHFDVALIPYKLTENTRYMYPVKLHEYLIMGKPVVSTNLPEVSQFSEVVYIARTREEFAEKVEKALMVRDEGRRKKGIQTAHANTWEHRLKKITDEMRRVNGQTRGKRS
jgi:glycosyltransferase involved in cell wall biosynthesis